jgi:hypothetical protein
MCRFNNCANVLRSDHCCLIFDVLFPGVIRLCCSE